MLTYQLFAYHHAEQEPQVSSEVNPTAGKVRWDEKIERRPVASGVCLLLLV